MIFCHKCGRETHWETMARGSTRERCTGCGDVYPCYGNCEHLDCQSDRGDTNSLTVASETPSVAGSGVVE